MSHFDEHKQLKPVVYELRRKTLYDGLSRLMKDEALVSAIYNHNLAVRSGVDVGDRLEPYPLQEQILSKFVKDPVAFDSFVLNFAVSFVVISIEKQKDQGLRPRAGLSRLLLI